MIPKTQTAVIQLASTSQLPLTVSHTVPVPDLPSPHHVLVRVLAAGLNPTDYKMATRFRMPGNATGCDFCGIVEAAGTSSASLPRGTRVCGAVFPYRRDNRDNGAFAEWVVADSRHVLRVPDGWTDAAAAALGAVGWATACVALSDPEALGLAGVPSKPVGDTRPVLVYGGGTATGLVAVQMLKLLVWLCA
jgi:NADPH:quinone reductase-like Zn-dependent oxidoreductase